MIEFIFGRFIVNQSVSFHTGKNFIKIDTTEENLSTSSKLLAVSIKELPNLLGLVIFFCAAYFSYFRFIDSNTHFVQLLFLAVLLSISIVRSISIISRIVLSPPQSKLRILPISSGAAKFCYRLVLAASIYITSTMMFSVLVYRFGGLASTVHLLQIFFITLLLIAISATVLYFKNNVKEYILSTTKEHKQKLSWDRNRLAAIWHIPVLLYIFMLWWLLINDVATVEQKRNGAFLFSFLAVPLWAIADAFVRWIVQYTMETLHLHQLTYENVTDVTPEELERRNKGQALYNKVLTVVRIVLAAGFLIWIASLWSIHVSYLSNLIGILQDIFIIMTLALLFWQLVSSWIEKKIQESLPEEEEDEDDEWGAASARGRSYTLLPMVRKFIATVLIVMVTMMILSSMGVDIGPLLAGAGVLGIAIGFGAQKLVSDIFSGFFYLLDDAFRVGEYVKAGDISGSVENITLRNVMLRHHRGMLQIVPYSDLGAITNYMRGGIVVKFNLDFPYDADIDKIRKIIKKVGIAMLQDEEFGKDFIQPVKSQGVREITNSVMTIRVKFTAEPGTHFVIRREAYKRITEALNNKGIFYAHKKVIVDIPYSTATSEQKGEDVNKMIEAAGAATTETEAK